MKARGSDVRVGRVLHEDNDLLTLEIAKRDDRPLQIESGDRFLTVLFVHRPPDAPTGSQALEAWLPWEDT